MQPSQAVFSTAEGRDLQCIRGHTSVDLCQQRTCNMEPNLTHTAADEEPATFTPHRERTLQRRYRSRQQKIRMQTRGTVSQPAVWQGITIHSTLFHCFLASLQRREIRGQDSTYHNYAEGKAEKATKSHFRSFQKYSLQ